MMHSSRFQRLYALLFLCFIFSNIANAKLSGTDFTISVYVGPEANDIYEVIHSQSFVPLEKNVQSTAAHPWIKVNWNKSKITNEQFLLNNDFDVNQHQTYMVVKNGKVIAKYQSSKAPFFDASSIKHFRFLVDIADADYVLVQTCCNTQYSHFFYLLSDTEVGEDYHARSLGYAVAYSLITLMILYNLFIGVYLREKPYFWYCFYLGTGLIGLISLSGFGRLFLWPETQNLLVIYFNQSAWFSISGILFVVNFLDSKLFSKRTLQVIRVAIFFCATVSVLSVASYLLDIKFVLNVINRHLVTVQFVAWVGFMVNSYIIILNMFAGDTRARIVLLSYTIVEVGMLVITLRNNYALPDTFWTTYAMEIAMIIEAIILSLVLAQNVQRLRKEKNQLQKQFSWRLIEAQEEEKKQFSLALHDEFTHKLLLLKSDIDTKLGSKASEGEFVSEILDGMRDLSHVYHPHMLPELGLKLTLDEMIARIKGRHTLDISLAIKDIELNDTQQLLVYRMIQESINNVIKHANANECMISLKPLETDMELIIIDDGRGFDVESKSTGLGLKTLRERCDMLSGNLKITSNNDGTEIRVIFPKNPQNEKKTS